MPMTLTAAEIIAVIRGAADRAREVAAEIERETGEPDEAAEASAVALEELLDAIFGA